MTNKQYLVNVVLVVTTVVGKSEELFLQGLMQRMNLKECKTAKERSIAAHKEFVQMLSMFTLGTRLLMSYQLQGDTTRTGRPLCAQAL